MHRSRFSLFIAASLPVLVLLTCSTTMAQFNPSAAGFVRLGPKDAASVQVRPSDLGIEWSKRKPEQRFAVLAELRPVEAVWVKFGKRVVANQPQRIKGRRAAFKPQCYFERFYPKTRVALPGGICFEGTCRPITLYFIVDVGCTNRTFCQCPPPNEVVCEYLLFGKKYRTSEPTIATEFEVWHPCPGTGNKDACK